MDERSMIDTEGSDRETRGWWNNNVHCDDRQGPSSWWRPRRRDEEDYMDVLPNCSSIVRGIDYEIGNYLRCERTHTNRLGLLLRCQLVGDLWKARCTISGEQTVYPHYLQDSAEYDDRKLLLCYVLCTWPDLVIIFWCCAWGKGWTRSRRPSHDFNVIRNGLGFHYNSYL